MISNKIIVLCADDDFDDQLLIREAWEECKIINPLKFVNDGVELMDYLNRKGKYADEEKYPSPGMILLDLNMPRKSGREVLLEIQSNEKLNTIPIIILTTSRAEEDILKAYDLGVNSFITKPVTFDGLIRVFDTLGKYWFEIVSIPKIN